MIAGTGPERHGIYRDAATNVLNSEATRRWVTEQARIDRLMADVTDAALAAEAGERVLDVGCGTSTTVLRSAEVVGPSGRVLGIDISEQQLALARQRVAAAGVSQSERQAVDRHQ